ncbi:MAG: hypothetical protein HYW08_10100, partial [candidate division NC10 bacterium]|nr:hypothetical protein [candidate division NC10 bacterium]
IDRTDTGEAARIEDLGIRVRTEGIVMRGPEDKRRVARAAVKFVEEL